MKKIFLFALCAMFTLFSGVMLASCGNSKYYISFDFAEPDFVTAAVEVDGNEVLPNGSDRFETRANSKVRVKLSAKRSGVDMSNIVVKANGEEKEVWKYNTSFDSLHAGGDLYYGYILFSGMKKNVTISVSGAESYKNTFTFEGADLTDKVSVDRIKNTQVRLPGSDEFVDFFEFLSGENKSFSVDMVGQNELARSFDVKFGGGNPYEITQISPFTVEYQQEKENDTQETVTKELETKYESGIYTFQIGDIENKIDAKILINFRNLKLRDFELNIPKNNKTFETEIEISNADSSASEQTNAQTTAAETRETFNFESKGKITINKVLADVDITNIKASINDLELEKDPEAENQENSVAFLLPSGITPESTGGKDSYNLNISGINYGDKTTITLKASTTENHPTKLIVPDFSSINGEGERDLVAGYDDEGNQLAFEDMKMSLDWKYPELDERYTTPFDLYDYDVMKNGEKLFNVLEVINLKKEEGGYVEGQNLEVSLDGGFVLKAIYNTTTQKYDEYHLEFIPEEDTSFTFENFELMEKNLNVSFDFEDARVGSVAFAVGDASAEAYDLEWSEPLTKGQSVAAKMTFGQVLFFRLKAEVDISSLGDGSEFTLEYTIANDNRTLKSTIYRDEDEDYLILKFPLSDFYFETTENMKLVLASSLGPR